MSSPSSRETFLIEAAMMLHRYGAPSHRMERVMGQVADSLGMQGEFLYTPTALVISLRASGGQEHTVVRRVRSGEVDVDKLIRFDDLLGKVEAGKTDVDQAMIELRQIAESPSLYSATTIALACAAASASVAVFFGGGPAEILAAAAVGLVIAMIESLHQRWSLETGLLEPIAGMVAALTSLLVAHAIAPIDDRLVTLAGLIVLIPGLRLTVALTELAVGHLSAGVARLAGAMVSLATLFVGVALVWRVAGGLRNAPAVVAPIAMGWQLVALLVAPVSLAIVFRAAKRQWPVISVVAILGVAVSRWADPLFGLEVASFVGALTVGCASNLYARMFDRPALVPLTPGMLILVPGTLGYRSLAALLERHTLQGVQFGFATFLIGVSLVGGLLMSNVLVPPKRIL